MRPRTMLVSLAVAAAVLVGLPAPSAMATTGYERVVDITFPVAGPNSYIDDYHHNRSGGRKHQATDIMAARGQKVHAAVGGTITWITGLDGPPPSYGYMITVRGDDSLTYNYIHLGTQTGAASEAYAPGLTQGSRVQRGQWIGYVGCSGNASCSAPHLHFEIVDPNLNDPRIATAPYRPDRINPYNSLKAAEARGDVPGGMRRLVPVSGDWNGDGFTNVGWFHDGVWTLRMTNGSTVAFRYGVEPGDVPVTGDWNGDGRYGVGVHRNGTWYLRNSLASQRGLTAYEVPYGLQPGDVPVTGDWNGDGRYGVGVHRNGTWYLRNSLANQRGLTVHSFRYGVQSGDVPVTGDWNRNGRHGVGILRDGSWKTWHLRNSLASSTGLTVHSFTYGRTSDLPVVGDWDRNGRQTPGLVRDATWFFNNSFDSSSDSSLTFGP